MKDRIVIYSSPSCMKCRMLMNKLDTFKIKYLKEEKHDEINNASGESGLLTLPIIRVERLDKIEWFDYSSFSEYIIGGTA